MTLIQYFILLLVVCRGKQGVCYSLVELNNMLADTTQYFEKLVHKYEYEESTPDLMKHIDNKIDDHKRNIREKIIRSKRHVGEIGVIDYLDTNILTALKELPLLELSNVIDISFFKAESETATMWFTVCLNSSGIFLLRLEGDHFNNLGLYSVSNGVSLTTVNYANRILIIIRRSNVGIAIVQLILSPAEFVYEIQQINNVVPTDVTVWQINKHLYLGLMAENNIWIYTWLGTRFKMTHVIDFRAHSLKNYNVGETVHLIASGSHTVILKFDLTSRQFVLFQTLPNAKSISVFKFKVDSFEKHFISLSTGQSTILYKYQKGVFVPWQELIQSQKVCFTIMKNVVFLWLIRKHDVKLFQYEGRRFTELNFTYPKVKDVRQISLETQDYLIFHYDNNSWLFYETIWSKRNSESNMYNELKTWCFIAIKKANKTFEGVMDPLSTLKITNGSIKKVLTKKINSIGMYEMKYIIRRNNYVASQMKKINFSLSNIYLTKNPKFPNLQAENVTVRCKAYCSIKVLSANDKKNLLSNVKSLNEEYERLIFEKVRFASLNYAKCPMPGFRLVKVVVKEQINGFDFANMQKDILRTSGDQIISGVHTCKHLSSPEAEISLNIVTKKTRRKLKIKNIKVKELNTDSGGIIVPLNGQPAAILGTTVASTVRVKGFIELRGHIQGSGIKNLSPTTLIENNLKLVGNYSLGNVRILSNLLTDKLLTTKAKSYNQIKKQLISLNDSIPVHLTFNKNTVEWTNIVLPKFFNWLSKDSRNENIVNVTGTKVAKHRITINKSTFENLSPARLKEPLCSKTVLSSNVEISSLVVDKLIAKYMQCEELSGAVELEKIVSNTATNLQDIDLQNKKFIGSVHVSNANIDNFPKSTFLNSNTWRQSRILTGTFRIHNLNVRHLITPNQLDIPIPQKIKNVIVKGVINVRKVNGVNFMAFANDVVQPGKMISNKSITFADGLITKRIETTKAPINVYDFKKGSLYLGPKSIDGSIQVNSLHINKIFNYSSVKSPSNIIIKGSVHCLIEPIIEKISKTSVTDIFIKAWMLDEPVVIKTKIVEIKNVTLKDTIQVQKSIDTPYFGSWKLLKRRLLSKSRPQEIFVNASFKNLKVSNINGSSKSVIKTLMPYFHELCYNTLQQHKMQIIESEWNIDEFHALNAFVLHGKINGLNLTTDVARHNVNINTVKGKKETDKLLSNNVNGLEFDKWASKTLTVDNVEDSKTVKGQKTFMNIVAQDVSIFGTLAGEKINNFLRKSTNQTIVGYTKVKGNIVTRDLIVKGTLNDFDQENLFLNILKKHKLYQKIKSPMMIHGDFNINGNLFIQDSFHGLYLNSVNNINSILRPLQQRMIDFESVASSINNTFQRHTVYWDKLELFEKNIALLNSKKNVTGSTKKFPVLGFCYLRNTTFICNDQQLFSVPNAKPNSTSTIIYSQLESLSGLPIIVTVLSGFEGGLLIYSYNYTNRLFEKLIDLRIPWIRDGSAVASSDVLWIALNLKSHTTVLRFDAWHDLHRFNLPGSDSFVLNIVPDNDVMLIRNDGMWKLEGFAKPKKVLNFALNGQMRSLHENNLHFTQLRNENKTTLLHAKYAMN